MRCLVPALLTSALCVATASVAFGADMPVKAPRVNYYAPAPVATWAGFYVGGNVGWGWAKADATVGGVSGSTNFNGVIGGGQIGYNFQSGALVFGGEFDIQGSDQHRTDTLGPASVTLRIPYFLTARARAGYASDNWLFYLTGGAGYSKLTLDASVLGVTATANDYRWSWVVGGGVETMFSQRWSAKLEYLYMDTGNYTSSLFGVPYNGRVRDHILRLGANYHF